MDDKQQNLPRLSSAEEARLRADFVVPLIVGQMFAGLEPLDDVAEYTFHEIIGDLQPDCGLLCVALCAHEIAHHYSDTHALPIAKIMALESGRMIAEFGALWLQHADGDTPSIKAQKVRESLVHIPEDLESLADMLDATQDALPHDDILGRTLCDMMSLQARAHAEAAEDALLEIRLSPLPRAAMEAAAHNPAGAQIIPFPARHAR